MAEEAVTEHMKELKVKEGKQVMLFVKAKQHNVASLSAN